MFDSTSDLISRLLHDTVVELDIPRAQREAATREYQRVGNWLASYTDGDNGWVVQPQGSFLLNTVVRPEGVDEYDLDAVCRRELEKDATTQVQLKAESGQALRDYQRAHAELDNGPTDCKERKRCWTLHYSPSQRFHLDVLPAIPNPETAPTGILITDRKLREWQRSDPLAYAAWFKRQSETEFIAKRALLAEATRTAPQAIPDWEVVTTLHRTVQVLKIHRNNFFAEDLDARPASILITTLATHTYDGEQNLYSAVLEAADRMPGFVEQGEHGLLVPNPVEPRENFADRWRDHPQLAHRCFDWLAALGDDLRDAESRHGIDKVASRLSESFGQQPVEKATEALGDSYRRGRETGRLGFGVATGVLSTKGDVALRPHRFYGDVGRA